MSQTSTSVKYPRPLHTHTHTPKTKPKKKNTYPIGNKQTECPDKESPHYDGPWCLTLHLCERLLPRRQRATTAPSSSPTTLAILFILIGLLILYGRPLQFDIISVQQQQAHYTQPPSTVATYTKIYDGITTILHADHPSLQFAAMCWAYTTPSDFEYFFNKANHDAAAPW